MGLEIIHALLYKCITRLLRQRKNVEGEFMYRISMNLIDIDCTCVGIDLCEKKLYKPVQVMIWKLLSKLVVQELKIQQHEL